MTIEIRPSPIGVASSLVISLPLARKGIVIRSLAASKSDHQVGLTQDARDLGVDDAIQGVEVDQLRGSLAHAVHQLELGETALLFGVLAGALQGEGGLVGDRLQHRHVVVRPLLTGAGAAGHHRGHYLAAHLDRHGHFFAVSACGGLPGPRGLLGDGGWRPRSGCPLPGLEVDDRVILGADQFLPGLGPRPARALMRREDGFAV
jgi:hypothetical protein